MVVYPLLYPSPHLTPTPTVVSGGDGDGDSDGWMVTVVVSGGRVMVVVSEVKMIGGE